RVRAALVPDLADRWAVAERDTDAAFGAALSVLEADEAEELVRLCDQVSAVVDG
ncbi:MAG: hypothetical protein V7645_1880, partial [Actinomycetota bacterium]